MSVNRLSTHLTLYAILITLVLLLSGCLPFGADPADDLPEDVDPVVVADDRGEEFTFGEPPARIVAVGPTNTEILFALGVGDSVVGVDSFSNWPEDAADREDVGGIRDPSVETIIGLEPDLVVLSTTTKETLELLDELDIPIMGFEISDLDSTYATIETLAEVTGREQRGEEISSVIRQKLTDIRENIGEVPEERRVYFEVSPEPLWTAGPGSFTDDLIEKAGAENIFSDLEKEWAEVSPEKVIERDPHVIISPMPQTREMIEGGERPGWDEITAVQKDHIRKVDDDLVQRPGPRLVMGFFELAAAIWPDRLDDVPESVREYEAQLDEWVGE